MYIRKSMVEYLLSYCATCEITTSAICLLVHFWRDTFHPKFGQIHFAFWTNIPHSLDKYNCQFEHMFSIFVYIVKHSWITFSKDLKYHAHKSIKPSGKCSGYEAKNISYMHIWDILHKSIEPGEGGEYSGYSAYPGHTSPS